MQLDFVDQAKALWPRFALEAGLGAGLSQIQPKLLKLVETPTLARVVLHVPDPQNGGFVFKYEPRLKGAEHLQEACAFQLKIEPMFEAHEAFHIPKLIWSDVSEAALIFEHVAGPTAHARVDWVDPNSDERAAVLQEVGGWLGHLHHVDEERSDGQAPDWGWVAKFVSETADAVRADRLDVGVPKMFLGLCAMLHRLARAAQGAPTRRVNLHGDAHLGNFIHGPDGLYGIDLTWRGVGAAEIDIVRLMSRVRFEFGAVQDEDATLEVAARDWDSFAKGYGQDLRDSPVLALYWGLQILRDWKMISRQMIARSAQKKRRFEMIKAAFVDMREAGY